MLMAARRAREGERELRSGRWTGWRPTHLVGQGLAGRTLGLIGFGRIAQRTALKALDAIRAPTFEALAAEADILSLQVPGGEATRHLVNSARGSLVDEAALADALARGRLAAVGLDVYEREPKVHPGLLASPRSRAAAS